MESYNSRGREIRYGLASRKFKDNQYLPEPLGQEVLNFLGTNYTMPSKKKSKTTTKKRTRKVYTRKRFRTLQPYSIVRKFKTVTNTAFNPGAGGVDCQQLKLNSAYDPTGSIGAGQPLGFDQYSALYQRYAVVGWRVYFRFVSSDNSNAILVGFTPKRDASALASAQYYLECPGTVSRHMTPDIDKVEFGSKGTVKHYFLPKGGKLLTDDTLTALYTNDPSRLLYGHVWLQALDATADPALVNCVITIEQLVVFFDPIIPARS